MNKNVNNMFNDFKNKNLSFAKTYAIIFFLIIILKINYNIIFLLLLYFIFFIIKILFWSKNFFFLIKNDKYDILGWIKDISLLCIIYVIFSYLGSTTMHWRLLFDSFLVNLLVFLTPVVLFLNSKNMISGIKFFCKKKFKFNTRNIFLLISILFFYVFIIIWIWFDRSIGGYQFIYSFYINTQEFYIKCYNIEMLFLNFDYLLLYNFRFLLLGGIDGISLIFLLLITFLIPLCLLSSYTQHIVNVHNYCLSLLILEIFLIFSFLAMDLLTFFVFFESILIPIFFMIGFWGSRERKIYASFSLLLYTLFGSIFIFFSILILYYQIGTTSFLLISKYKLSIEKELFLWLFMYIAFSIKIPTIPFHIWLPEAHVEAPTVGSVILAGLLLKLGGYGFIRILLLFPLGISQYSPLIDTLAVISIIYASLTTIRQIDMKKIIAYSSIAHMNLVVLGIFSTNTQGILGGIYLMVAHGFVSSGLFFLIGVLYDRYGSRYISYYGGLIQVMPIFSYCLLILILGNIALPGTCNFIGEFIIFTGLIDINLLILFIALISVILCILYTVVFYNRLSFSNLNIIYILIFKDIKIRELIVIIPILFFTLIFGIWPNIILEIIDPIGLFLAIKGIF